MTTLDGAQLAIISNRFEGISCIIKILFTYFITSSNILNYRKSSTQGSSQIM